MKRTTKRTRGESSVEPPPWNHPLARYFASNEDFVYYEMRLAGRKEIPPRYLDPNLLVTQNFDHLREILEYQGIMNFVQIRDKYYPDLVAIAYSTLMIEVNEENESDFSLVFKLGKDEYKLGCSELAIIWGLPIQGCLFEGGKTPIGDWGYLKENAMGIFNLTQDLIIMWAMVNNININWPYFIMQHMIRLKRKETSGGLGGAIEEGQEDQEAQEAPPQAQEQAGPSMSDLMQVLQRIECKQNRMDRRLHRIEQYMEIEEDEDVDQD
ncbi:hypothetical protein PIB30_109314 [Stylosanthes scabra]|uniref:Uncharacterized protein n=1 Tax=Stylosanthes scabra TaxID=79078 RepID=A0ABU6V3H5_9FABA|nr:hypothetical protein [Stylosanthes scabra]